MALQDDYIRTALRVPRDLHKALHAAAAGTTRTFNAEIISRLQASFQGPMDLKREQLMLFINEAIDERLELQAEQASAQSKAVNVLIRGKKSAVLLPNSEDAPVLEIPGHDGEGDHSKRTRLVRGTASSPKKPRAGPVNKVIIVGNLGREPVEPVIVEPVVPKPTNRGPTRSPNARKPITK